MDVSILLQADLRADLPKNRREHFVRLSSGMAKSMKVYNFPAPKKGKQRAAKKKTSPPTKKTAAYQKVPYVRHGTRTEKSRPERLLWKRSLVEILEAPEKTLQDKLIADKILPEWAGATCPYCNNGVLGPRKRFKGRKGFQHKCMYRPCQRYVQPHDFHPIFHSGRTATSLKYQATALFLDTAHAQRNTTGIALKLDHKVVERIAVRNEHARQRLVAKEERKIEFGKGEPWKDIEADEVDIGSLVENQEEQNQKASGRAKKGKGKKSKGNKNKKKVKVWEQCGGIVERGAPHTLVLTRLSFKKRKSGRPALDQSGSETGNPLRSGAFREKRSSFTPMAPRHINWHLMASSTTM